MRWTVRLKYIKQTDNLKTLTRFRLFTDADDPDARGRRNIARMFRHTSEDD